MLNVSPWGSVVVVATLAALNAPAPAATKCEPEVAGTASMVTESGHEVRDDESPIGQLRPLPADAHVVRHWAAQPEKAEGLSLLGASGDAKLIYGSTLGSYLYSPGKFITIADDIHTESITECRLHRFALRVSGGVEDGDGYFDVRIRLLEDCQGNVIPGTELKFTGLEDDSTHVHELVVDYDDPNIGICSDERACRIVEQDCTDGSPCVPGPYPLIPPQVWLQVVFSTYDAGWVVGRPAERGYSADHYGHLVTGCYTWFGGYPARPYASFYTELYGADTCPTHFLAYLATTSPGDPSIPPFEVQPGTDEVRLADDIELIVDECELSVIEAGTKGVAGPYQMDFDIRLFPTQPPLPGTTRTFVSDPRGGVGNLEIARLSFAPGITVSRNFWITWQASRPFTGVLNAQWTQIGNSEPTYGAWGCSENEPPDQWHTNLEPEDETDAVFYFAVYCRGEAPTGACCVNQPDQPDMDPVCLTDVPVATCLAGRWLKDAACPAIQHDPNDPWTSLGEPACGTHACCLPNSSCGNLTRDECVTVVDDLGNPARWFSGEFCGIHGQDCPIFACFDAVGNCHDGGNVITQCSSNQECEDLFGPESYCNPDWGTCALKRGCGQWECCDYVCSEDPYCCLVAWDDGCAQMAQDCPGRPGNDSCWSVHPSYGAFLIGVQDQGDGTYAGHKESNHTYAMRSVTDNFCCHTDVGRTAYATTWYKFLAAVSGTALIHTCNTPGAPDATNSLVQVYRPADADIGICANGRQCSVSNQDCADLSECVLDEEIACENLAVIGCNDDGPSGRCGEGSINTNSEICVTGLQEGELYYIAVGCKTRYDQGFYRVDVEQPCPVSMLPPAESECETALTINPPPGDPTLPFSVPFDLTNATLDCPGEDCLSIGWDYEMQTMRNDIWFNLLATCPGELHVETCSVTPEDSDPDTTLAIYEGTDCPPAPESLLACNDDAVVDAFNHTLRSQVCSITATECDTNEDCAGMICAVVQNACESNADCDVGICVDDAECSVSAQDCTTGICDDGYWCTVGGGPCVDGSECDPRCTRTETCERDVCESSCGQASTVIAPVFLGEYYTIRLGGHLGSQPAGDLTIWCDPKDCNGNTLPDPFEISEGMSLDCNLNGRPDECDLFVNPVEVEEISEDCNANAIPDECEIFIGTGDGVCSNQSSCDVANPFCADGSVCVPHGQGPFFCLEHCARDRNHNGIPDECEGACCLPQPPCRVLLQPDCADEGGIYRGAYTTCDPDPCACPVGTVTWLDPQDGTIDARQPWKVDDMYFFQGIKSLMVDAPGGAGDGCWAFCETAEELSANDIELVAAHGDGAYTVELMRRITPGAVSTITYTDRTGSVQTGTFVSLPGDSNADGVSNTADILSLIDCCLNLVCTPAHGDYSCDIDHSAAVNSADILRLIDLLNGAGHFFMPWNLASPYDGGECSD
ncbi:MAG: hypothetical protein JSU63_03870 [Phycisphaerales bacterium]|nr:MAG: hypothetical protein JSU63_03870 [Phycisphaerales bacterium]